MEIIGVIVRGPPGVLNHGEPWRELSSQLAVLTDLA
jgi:hypothetical protein